MIPMIRRRGCTHGFDGSPVPIDGSSSPEPAAFSGVKPNFVT